MKQQIKVGTILTFIVLGIILLFLGLRQLAPLLILILIAIVLTTGIDPLVTRVQSGFTGRWRIPRSLATIIVLFLGFTILLGGIGYLIFTAVSEAIRFASVTWPMVQQHGIAWLNELTTRYTFIPSLDTLLDRIRAQSDRIAGYLWSTTRAVFGVLGGIFSLVTVVILTLFFTIFKDGITHTILQLVPPKYQQPVRRIGHHAAQRMGGWLRGQLLLALIVTVTVSLFMWILGAEYPILVGIIGGIGELVPMVGPYLAFFPAIAIVLLAGFPLWKIILLLVFFLMLSQVENYILSPKIMEKNVGLHPVTTVLALLIGGSLLGLVGALLAIPLAAGARVVMVEVVFPAIQGTHPPTTSDSHTETLPNHRKKR